MDLRMLKLEETLEFKLSGSETVSFLFFAVFYEIAFKNELFHRNWHIKRTQHNYPVV